MSSGAVFPSNTRPESSPKLIMRKRLRLQGWILVLFLGCAAGARAADDAISKWWEIKGLTVRRKLGSNGDKGTLGPLKLRKGPDDLGGFDDAKGATLSFSDNRLVDGNGAWNSEGTLYYPVRLNLWEGDLGRNLRLEFGTATTWNLAEVEGTDGNDVEEFGFSLPLTFRLSPGAKADPGGNKHLSRLCLIGAKPYYQTDFSFRHDIYGVEASLEFVGNPCPASSFYLGAFQNFTPNSPFQYQLRLIPKLDYSETAEGGKHTNRQKGDDWFRVGGLVSADFRYIGQTSKTLDLGVSYQALETLNGSGGYSDLLKANVTWWVVKNTGLTLDYSKGETPVADKDIDLIRVGLELKF
jgi:hypothetical protein